MISENYNKVLPYYEGKGFVNLLFWSFYKSVNPYLNNIT